MDGPFAERFREAMLVGRQSVEEQACYSADMLADGYIDRAAPFWEASAEKSSSNVYPQAAFEAKQSVALG